MPKGLPRRFSSFLRPLAGTRNDSHTHGEEQPQGWEDGESSLNTTLDRVETTLDRMSRALFAVDTVPKAVARAKANQLARSAGLRDPQESGTGAMETTPPLARSINSRTSALAQAVEELRMLELRVHEANAFTTDDEEPDTFDDQAGSFAPGSAEPDASTIESAQTPPTVPSELPLLVDVVSLGPNVISLDPPAPGLIAEPAALPARAVATPGAQAFAPVAQTAPAPTSPAARLDVPDAPTNRSNEKSVAPLEEAPATPASAVVRPAQALRPSSASVHDELSLEVADDVNSDQLCQFLAVLPELMESIQASSAAYADAPHARDEGVRARNALRQLELAAESVGIRGITSFAAHATSLLDALINTTATVPDELFATLRDAMACLEHLSDVVWGKTSLAADVPERLELLIEAELRAILDLTLRVEEPSYSASFDPLAGAPRSTAPAGRSGLGVAPVERPWRA